MAVSIGNISLKLTANAAGFFTGLGVAEKRLQSFARNAATTLSRFNRISGLSTAVVGTIAGGFGVGKAIALASEAEQAQVAFETMVGNAVRAAQLLREVRQLAANTPFSAQELQQSARTLLGYGIAVDDVLTRVRMLGDISAGTGKNLGELSVIFGQIRSTGRLVGQDALQLTQAGIPIYEELGKVLGKTGLEMRKMGEAGLISFEMVDDVFKRLTSEGGRFFKLNERISQTLGGLWHKLQASLTLTLMRIGEVLVRDLDLKGFVNTAINFAEAMRGPVVEAIKQAIGVVKSLGAALLDLGKSLYLVLKFFAIGLSQQNADALVKAFADAEKIVNQLIDAMTRAQTVAQAARPTLSLPQNRPFLSDTMAETLTGRILKDSLRTPALSTVEDTSARARVLFGLFREGALTADQTRVALKELEGQMKKTFAQDAVALTKSLATPLEVFKAELADLDAMLKRNFINQELYGRAVKKTFDQLADTIKFSTDSPGAILAGSQEAQAARTRSLNQLRNETRRKDPVQAIEDLRKQQAREHQEEMDLLRKLGEIRPKLVDIK